MAGFSFSTNPATSSSSSPFSFASSSSSTPSRFSFSNPSSSPSFGAPLSSASSTPSFWFSFASSYTQSSAYAPSATSPSFGFGASLAPTTGSTLFGTSSPAVASPFGGSELFGSSSSSTGAATTSLFGSSSTFRTTSIFGASSAPALSSNTTTTVSSSFSSGLFGSSSSSTTFGASSAPALSSNATTTVGSSPFSSGLFGSSSSSTTFGSSPSGTPSTSSLSTTSGAPSFPGLFGASSSSAASSFSNLTGASSSSSISSPITTPPISSSTPGFSFLNASSSSSVTSSASPAPSFSFPSAPTSAPSFSFSTSSTTGKSTASAGSSGSAASTAVLSVGSSSSPSSFSFANVTASSGLQSSLGLASNLKASSTTVTATTTASASTSASKTPSFPSFGVTSTTSTTASTGSGSMPSFSSPTSGAASTGTSSSFLGFQTSSKTTGVPTPTSQPQSTAASSLSGVPAATTTTSTVTTAQTSSSLVVSSSSGTTTSASTTVASAPKLPSEITGKTVEEIIKEWNVELQERTGKFRKQANAMTEWDKRILQNRDVLLKLEAEVAKVVETQSNLERQLELIETHQEEVDKSLQSVEEEPERIYKDERGLFLDDEAASTRDAMYEQAEFIERELEQMTEQIKSVIQTLNASQAGEFEVTDGMTPLDVVVRILNNQLSSLMWIDEKRLQQMGSTTSPTDRMGPAYEEQQVRDAVHSFHSDGSPLAQQDTSKRLMNLDISDPNRIENGACNLGLSLDQLNQQMGSPTKVNNNNTGHKECGAAQQNHREEQQIHRDKVHNSQSGISSHFLLEKNQNDTTANAWDTLKRNRISFAKMMKEANEHDDEKFTFVPPKTLDNGEVIAIFSADEIKKASASYTNQLYGYFIGTSMDFRVVQACVRRLWRNYDFESVAKNNAGFYFFKFATDEGMNAVIENGQWFVDQIPLFLHKWEPGLALEKVEPNKLPVWALVHNVPLELWTISHLAKLASCIGKPCLLDRVTKETCTHNMGRIGYARMMIEIDASKEIPEVIKFQLPALNGRPERIVALNVSYQWKPKLCSKCKVFGHSISSCRFNQDSQKEGSSIPQKDSVPTVVIGKDTEKHNALGDGFKVVSRKKKTFKEGFRVGKKHIEVAKTRLDGGKSKLVYRQKSNLVKEANPSPKIQANPINPKV